MELNQKTKIVQFEGGAGILANIDTPINVYIDCRQIVVNNDGQSVFDTAGWPVPLKNVDWRTIKVTVNGASFYEGQSFERTDDGMLTWTDPTFKLQKDDIFFAEWTVDGANYDPFMLEEVAGLLYIVVNNYLVTVEHEHVRYPLIIELGEEGQIYYYILKDDGTKVYFTVNEDGTIKEVDKNND